MKTLYEIGKEQLAVIADIEMNEGEITEEIQQRINFLAENFEEKAVAYGFVIKKFDDDVTLIDNEIKRLQGLKKKALKVRDYLDARISTAMHEFGFEKVQSPTLTLSFRKSQAVEVFNEALLPQKYFNYAPTVDKTAIKTALKEGVDVQGARLITNENLQIK